MLCCLHQPVFAVKQSYHHVGFYIENFGGRVDPETLPQVYEVFEKVSAVADVNSRALPQLTVIKDMPGPPAIVLPDGNLILAEKALKVIYDDVPRWEGNTRLAFVLGHELAHLASDDSWNAEVKHLIQSKSLSGEIDESLLEQDPADLMEKELKADDKGFLYAAMAGFPVEALLANEKDFLSYWVDSTNTRSSKVHPDAAERTDLLRRLLQDKRNALEFFHMGVRLAHFERQQDAVYFFRKFQKVFPGREVFNNLGVCYLQMAMEEMPPAQAYQYWLPHVLDTETIINRARAFPIFRDGNQIKRARDFLQKAVRHLKIATEKDPAYAIGYINLAVAHFYLDEIYKARAAIEDARRLTPDNYEIESLRALILFEEGQPMDTWSHAEKIFSAMADDHPSDALPLSVYYNWAKLLEARGRSAEDQWQKLTNHITELPWPIARMLCERSENRAEIENCLKKINQTDAVKETAFPKPLPIQPGFEAWRFEAAEHPLKDWHKLPFHWRGEAANSGIIYHNSQNDVVLEMNEVVEMVVLRQNLGQAETLLQTCGQPHHKKTVMNGELWSYGHWAALIEEDRVKELWVVRKNDLFLKEQ